MCTTVHAARGLEGPGTSVQWTPPQVGWAGAVAPPLRTAPAWEVAGPYAERPLPPGAPAPCSRDCKDRLGVAWREAHSGVPAAARVWELRFWRNQETRFSVPGLSPVPLPAPPLGTRLPLSVCLGLRSPPARPSRRCPAVLVCRKPGSRDVRGGARPLSAPRACPAGAAGAGEAPGRGREGPARWTWGERWTGGVRRGALGQVGAGAPRAPGGGAGWGVPGRPRSSPRSPRRQGGTLPLPVPRGGPALTARRHGPLPGFRGLHTSVPHWNPRPQPTCRFRPPGAHLGSGTGAPPAPPPGAWPRPQARGPAPSPPRRRALPGFGVPRW